MARPVNSRPGMFRLVEHLSFGSVTGFDLGRSTTHANGHLPKSSTLRLAAAFHIPGAQEASSLSYLPTTASGVSTFVLKATVIDVVPVLAMNLLSCQPLFLSMRHSGGT